MDVDMRDEVDSPPGFRKNEKHHVNGTSLSGVSGISGGVKEWRISSSGELVETPSGNGNCVLEFPNRSVEVDTTNTNDTKEEDEEVTDILVPPVALIPPMGEAGVPASGVVSSGKETNDSRKFWDYLRSKSSKDVKGQSDPVASCNPLDFEYNMTHPRRGKAIIFNHSRFDSAQGLNDRPGTEVDVRALLYTLTQKLHFNVDVYHDLTFLKIDNILETVSLMDDHKESDCLVIIVLSHGRLNKLHAYDLEYNPEILWNRFTADKCPQLAGKPKLFFIQACRGDKYDDGTLLMPLKRGRTVVDGPGDVKPYKIPNQADFLTVFSTVEAFPDCVCKRNASLLSRFLHCLSFYDSGHYSWRNSNRGSCFIQALCSVLNEYHSKLDVLSMMTIVNCQVAINYESKVPSDMTQHQKKQVPHVSHTLTRQIRLLPKGTLV